MDVLYSLESSPKLAESSNPVDIQGKILFGISIKRRKLKFSTFFVESIFACVNIYLHVAMWLSFWGGLAKEEDEGGGLLADTFNENA